MAGVADVADELAVLVPDAEGALAAAVLDAVGGDLAGGEDEVFGAPDVEARCRRAFGDELAHVAQVGLAEVHPDRPRTSPAEGGPAVAPAGEPSRPC